MDNLQEINRKFNAFGWGLLLILWGATLLFDFVPFGVGVLGTGLIFLGANGIRYLSGLPLRKGNNLLGLLAVTWGLLDLARPLLSQVFAFADWDWAIFAFLLVELGFILLVRELLRVRKAGFTSPGSHA